MFRAEIEATNHCNTRCLHCPHEAITRPKGRMTWETFSTLIERIRAHTRGERYQLSFSGMGEPLLNPELFRFIRHVSAEAETSFASNGAILTEENVARLMDSGLDAVYLSFNGDEPELYRQMMGGLRLDRVWANAQRAVELARNSRLQIRANIVATKVNRHRLTEIRERLETAGIGPVTVSLCHSRGGNLRDSAVCDTPPMGDTDWPCDVMANTLFVDWRGQAFICDHDLHGEYPLGDLMTESLEAVLARRQALLDRGVSFKICRECNDIMRVGNALPIPSGAGGNFRDWIYHLHKEQPRPLPHATPPFAWIYRIYAQENRLDRMVDRLLEIERDLQAENAHLRDTLRREVETLRTEVRRKEEENSRLSALLIRRELEAERPGLRHFLACLVESGSAWIRRRGRFMPGKTSGAVI